MEEPEEKRQRGRGATAGHEGAQGNVVEVGGREYAWELRGVNTRRYGRNGGEKGGENSAKGPCKT